MSDNFRLRRRCKKKKITAKELKALRLEFLVENFQKNKRYLSLENLKKAVLSIDYNLQKDYSCESLGKPTQREINLLHKQLFDKRIKEKVIESILSDHLLKNSVNLENILDKNSLVEISALLGEQGIVLSLQSLKEKVSLFCSQCCPSNKSLLAKRFLENQKLKKDIISLVDKTSFLSAEKAFDLILRIVAQEDKLGIQTFAEERSKRNSSLDLGNEYLQQDRRPFSALKAQENDLIQWTEKQRQAINLFWQEDIRTLVLYGGGRSGKTTVALTLVLERCLSLPSHKAIIVRENFNALKRSIVDQSLNGFLKPKFSLDFKQNLSSPARVIFPNGSSINLAGIVGSNKTSGLDTHLGNEYATFYLNESSQISWESYKLLMTRANDPQYPIKVIIDLNPTSVNHWVYKYFIEKIDPDTDEPLLCVQEDYAVLQINPKDNQENLSTEYIKSLRSLGSAYARRFEQGEWSQANENSIFPTDWLQWIDISEEEVFDYVCIAVDPAMSSKETSNETGIVVCAMKREKQKISYYVLEDVSGRYTPEVWAVKVVSLFHKYHYKRAKKQTVIFLEKNQGGDTLKSLLRNANNQASLPIKEEHTKKDKVTRALYVSSLYEKRQVFHTQKFQRLERQMSALGLDEEMKNDDRVDALVHALTYLFHLTCGRVCTLDVL